MPNAGKLGEFVHNNTKPLFRIVSHFWTITKYAGEVSLIISVDIHRESRLTQCVRTLISVEHIEISLYAQTQQSLLLLTQGNIYIHLRFLNKYLVFEEELNELFRENWSKFLTAVYLVFWKQFPVAGYLDTAEYRNTKIRSTMLGCPWTVSDDKCAGLLTNTRSNMVLRSKISKSHLGTHAFRLKLLQRHKTKAYFWS